MLSSPGKAIDREKPANVSELVVKGTARNDSACSTRLERCDLKGPLTDFCEFSEVLCVVFCGQWLLARGFDHNGAVLILPNGVGTGFHKMGVRMANVYTKD
jgi:hypothetical protein